MTSPETNKILIIAAHPDDEVLGCGGTIAHHADAGDRVQILIMALTIVWIPLIVLT